MNIIIIFILLQVDICLDLKACHFALIVWWKQSGFYEWEMLLCRRFKWRQRVWQRPCATSDAPGRDEPVVMMHTQPLQTYSISVVFLMRRRAQHFLITSGGLSGTFDNSSTWLSTSVSPVILYSSKGAGSSWFGQLNYSCTMVNKTWICNECLDVLSEDDVSGVKGLIAHPKTMWRCFKAAGCVIH